MSSLRFVVWYKMKVYAEYKVSTEVYLNRTKFTPKLNFGFDPYPYFLLIDELPKTNSTNNI